LRGISLRALRALADYSWPGNVRELGARGAPAGLLMCPAGNVIDLPLLSERLRGPQPEAAAKSGDGAVAAQCEDLSLAVNVGRWSAS
jgi:DNA-binding NtrC family response regulator